MLLNGTLHGDTGVSSCVWLALQSASSGAAHRHSCAAQDAAQSRQHSWKPGVVKPGDQPGGHGLSWRRQTETEGAVGKVMGFGSGDASKLENSTVVWALVAAQVISKGTVYPQQV